MPLAKTKQMHELHFQSAYCHVKMYSSITIIALLKIQMIKASFCSFFTLLLHHRFIQISAALSIWRQTMRLDLMKRLILIWRPGQFLPKSSANCDWPNTLQCFDVKGPSLPVLDISLSASLDVKRTQRRLECSLPQLQWFEIIHLMIFFDDIILEKMRNPVCLPMKFNSE